ncbi:MAG: asparagine synthase (glutamine-hydrolyzing) [candidate division KSB1 bacterium]|nr:asparagine synthase (glutamine-hydrolyzing) [candidate division KSB1 bacterium]MDZ7384753.1 asparagine synthase (glutamine-hydrolyzing) [candidate division KSB1 bacterium]
MCGICGIYYVDGARKVDPHLLRRMAQVIVHRGPDDDGFFLAEGVGLGMRRLSIIDLVTGKQPISNEDGTVWVVYNGEIYNHLSLRRALEAKGHRFRTKADTEVIAHAYEEYGERCPEYFNGMFAFALYDARSRRLLLARDRLGIKPLYYAFDGQRLVFGSELKSLLQVEDMPRELDVRALDTFLTFEYIPAPLSIFRGVAKLPQAHTLLLQDGQARVREYWHLAFGTGEPVIKSEEQWGEELVSLLGDAVQMRLMSDVPLGAFLSGGLDSSSVVAMMSRSMDRPVKTFSIGFSEASYNELDYARTVAHAFGTEHHEEIITPDAVSLTETLIAHLDEPLGDFSIFPTYMVSKMTRQYVTVALSGDGGDELLAGYDTYLADRLARSYLHLPRVLRQGVIEPLARRLPPTEKKKGLINRTTRFVQGMALPEHLQHVRWMIFLSQAQRQALYTPPLQEALAGTNPYEFIEAYFEQARGADPLSQQQYVDIKTYLADDILVKVDRMSMAVSLEARVPFLDYRLVELVGRMPSWLRLRNGQTKYILKRAMRGILPEKILTRGKEGFSIPIKNWLRAELRPMMLDLLSPERLRAQGYFEDRYVESLIKEHLAGKANHSHQLWALMVFQKWYDLYMRRAA